MTSHFTELHAPSFQQGRQPTVTLNVPGREAPLQLTGDPALFFIMAVLVVFGLFVYRFFRWRYRARKTYQRLKEAESQLMTLFAAMDDVVQVLDRHGVFVRVPPTKGKRRFGKVDELVGHSVAEVLPAEAAAHVNSVNLQAIESAQSVRTEFSAASGSDTAWFSATVSPLDTNSAIWVVRDVTDQRLARDEVSRRDAQYRLLFDHNPCAMWLYDFDTTEIFQVNDAAISQYGFSREEFTSMTLADLRAPSAVEELKMKLSSIDYDRESVDVVQHQRKDGTRMDVEVLGRPISVDGHRARLVVVTDITERLRAEQSARVTGDLLQSVIDTAPQAIVVCDAAWNVTRWNMAAEQLFGWKAHEILGAPPPCIPHEHREWNRRATPRENIEQDRRTIEVECARKDGGALYVLLAMAPLRDHNHDVTGYVAVFTDLTARMLLDEQQRQSQKMEAVGRLAGGIAHDFNNLLTVISSYTDLLRTEIGDGPAKGDLDEIMLATQRATSLTRQLLSFSRRDIVMLRAIDVNDVIRNMQGMLRRLLNADIALNVQLAENTWKITGDTSQIEQVVMNLVVNAADAMADGGMLLVSTENTALDEAYILTHGDVIPGDYVMLAVSDSGIGMDAETLSRAFEPFFTTKSVGRGTGLGLATVYAIVKQLHGHVWIYSEPKQGTTFKVYLPRQSADAVEAVPPAEPVIIAPATHESTSKRMVLLVEDDDALRRVVRRMLEHMNYSVIDASNGLEALKIMWTFEGTIDLVMTDLMMPEMSGRELVDALAISNPGQNVLFTSGYTDDVAMRRGLKDSAHSFLQKPYTADQLQKKLASLFPA